jgi:hypothetical protein
MPMNTRKPDQIESIEDIRYIEIQTEAEATDNHLFRLEDRLRTRFREGHSEERRWTISPIQYPRAQGCRPDAQIPAARGEPPRCPKIQGARDEPPRCLEIAGTRG